MINIYIYISRLNEFKYKFEHFENDNYSITNRNDKRASILVININYLYRTKFQINFKIHNFELPVHV